MTAAPHSIATAHAWRTIPVSPIAAAETAASMIFALIVVGVMAVHARAALQSAQQSAAAAEIKVIDPIVSAYGLDNSGYAEMTPAALKQSYNLQLDKGALRTLEITGASTSGFCIQIRDGAWYAARQGPTGAIETSRNKICR
jgi:S-adenosylhomocysteine hydrolase